MWGVSTVFAVYSQKHTVQRSGAQASNGDKHCCINAAECAQLRTHCAKPQKTDVLAGSQLAADRKE
jgi:hypothetical protein